ncbi:hypothetical protein KSU13_02695 [Fusobacterium nucleatum]|uniref:hypothetical protein n=1 Tax=Fusobacterium nucleatum TaxID=851 RepID=UPI0030CE084E
MKDKRLYEVSTVLISSIDKKIKENEKNIKKNYKNILKKGKNCKKKLWSNWGR